MGIRLKEIPEYGVVLSIFSGAMTTDELTRHFEGLTGRGGKRWLDYFDSTVNLSKVDIASLPKLKRIIAAKQHELFRDSPPAIVVVCGSSVSEQLLSFWDSYVATGEVRLAAPVVLGSLEAACDRLGLPDAARAAVKRAVEDEEPAATEIGPTGANGSAAPLSR